jgi:cell division protein YceG involved in septum cleavage
MPDTYRIANGSDVTTLVDTMLANFTKKIYTPFLASGKPVESLYDVLTLASIVQEEENSSTQIPIVQEEENSSTQIPIVADILKKRLRKGWQIGADVTVCYAELIPGNECQKYINNFYSLTPSARAEKNNTYDTRGKMGLPPTPIASVTADTFLATLNATAETPAWFYLHDNQGVIHIAVTNEEHEVNKEKYLR